MKKLRVSLVTICLNARDELEPTLRSVLGQEPAIDEYIVVDGGSADGTRELLAKYADHFAGRLVWRSEPDGGIAAAFNKGLDLAHGDAILFLNAGDELIDHRYVGRALERLAASPDVAFVHADILFEDALAGTVLLPALHGAPFGRGMPYRHQTMLVRREAFEICGPFDETLRVGMDFDLVCRMAAAGLAGVHDGAGPVVRMDGCGVSVVRERLGMREAVRSLKATGLWTWRNRLGHARRFYCWLARRLLVACGLSRLLAALKRRKYGEPHT